MSTPANQLRDGSLNVDAYVSALIDGFEAEEPTIFSFVPEARRWDRVAAEASALIERWPEPASRPPLFAVPIGVKDIFHVEGMLTRGGSSLPPEVLASAESDAVTRLKQAGALVLGKTITTEFAYFGPGPARNPHNPLHTPGGSSSGSAAAVGAGIVPIALGTQTIGSINRPAAFCGCVGFKPSYDRVSRAGVLELSRSHDHIGVLADGVDSAELAIAAMMADWRGATAGNGVKPTLAVPIGPYLHRATDACLQHFHEAIAALEAAGYVVKRVEAMADFDRLEMQHRRLMAVEAARYHAQFAEYHVLYHEKTLELIAAGQGVSDADVSADIQAKCDLATDLTALMDAHDIDVWLTPASIGPAPRGHASTGDPIMQLPWTMAGLPTLNIPWGMIDGMPMGLQFIGRFGSDEALFAYGRELETRLDG